MALVHDESCKKKKNMSHMTIVTFVLFSCAVVFVLCVFVVCPAKDSLVTKKRVFFVISGEVVKAMASKSVDTR